MINFRKTIAVGLAATGLAGAAAVTWTEAEENVVRPEAPGSDAGEVWIASTEYKFVPATVRVIAGRSVTLVLDNSQAETAHSINVPAFGFYLVARGGRVTRKTFIFDEPGVYVFVCDMPGHQESGMEGKLIVNGPAQGNVGKPFSWGGDYAHAEVVTSRLQAANIDNGIKQINPQTTAPVVVGDVSWRRTDFTYPSGEGHYAYFRVDPEFVPFGTNNLEITAVVRRVASDKVAGMNLEYESLKGYIGAPYFNIPEDDQWHELTWKVTDANFVGGWGWNFRLDAIASPNEFYIKEVRVKKSASP
jgi:plastocyanin